jgi:sulfite exporter TauE/SafE
MCGGIVTALSFGLPASQENAGPSQVFLSLEGRKRRGRFLGDGSNPRWPYLLCYNLGRIGSYTLIGALLGALAGGGLTLLQLDPLKIALYVLANLMLIGMGLYLAGLSALIGRVERLGAPLWARLQPRLAKLLPIRSVPQALAVGALWGWMPCGLVYSASLSALATGNAASGALVMLAFGLGTLPNLLAMGAFASSLKTLLQKRPVRLAAGLAVVALGVFRLAQLLWA